MRISMGRGAGKKELVAKSINQKNTESLKLGAKNAPTLTVVVRIIEVTVTMRAVSRALN